MCNKSIGVKHMDEFVKEYYPDNYNKYIEREYTILNTLSYKSDIQHADSKKSYREKMINKIKIKIKPSL